MIDLARAMHDATDAALTGTTGPAPGPVQHRIRRRRALVRTVRTTLGTGLAAVAAVTATQLATTGPTPPAQDARSWTSPAWFAEHEAMRTQYQSQMQGCLRGLGWDVTVDRDGGIVEPFTAAELDRYTEDRTRCDPVGFPADGALEPPTEQQLRDVYAKDLDTWACLRHHGFPVADPPTEEEYIARWPTADGWRPLLDPALSLGSEPVEESIRTTCPEPWALAPAANGTVGAATDGTYWYSMSKGADGTVHESWTSLDRPGLVVTDRDLTTAAGIGPQDAFGSYLVDGQWIEPLEDATVLPTDPQELGDVLRASVQLDPRSSTEDEKVFRKGFELVMEGGLVPTSLRRAAWAVMSTLPGAVVSNGADSTGRAGQVLDFTEDGRPTRLTWDARTALLLEGTSAEGSTTKLAQRFSDDPLPVEPTLASSGCTTWESC